MVIMAQERKYARKDVQRMKVAGRNGHMYKFMYGGTKRKSKRVKR